MNAGCGFPVNFICDLCEPEPGAKMCHQLTLGGSWGSTNNWYSPGLALCRLSPNHWETLHEKVNRARDIRVFR